MCLLIAYSRVIPGAPLLVAGNRDELLARPARPMELLEDRPRILGGRDLVAGGTWMAVGEHGIVAALTNRPPRSQGERPSLRTRGELPLRLVREPTAKAAVEAFVASVDPRQYNPCWILVGDRRSLFYLEISSAVPIVARELPAGVHILENRPLEAASPKVSFVREHLPRDPRLGTRLLGQLAAVLSNPQIPPAALRQREPGDWRPAEVEAARVRAGPYGTRWSGIAALGSSLPPHFCFTDGAAGDVPFRRAGWDSTISPPGRSSGGSRT